MIVNKIGKTFIDPASGEYWVVVGIDTDNYNVTLKNKKSWVFVTKKMSEIKDWPVKREGDNV